MTVYLSSRDEPRIVWNVNNPKTMNAMKNHLESISFSSNFTSYNQSLNEMCHFPSKSKPWISMEHYHAVFASPVTVDYTTDLLPVISWVTYGKCFADIRVPNWEYYAEYANSFLYLLTNSSFLDDKTTWEDKKPLVYWRGSNSGGSYTIKTLDKNHRNRFMRLYQNHSLFDIALTGTTYCGAPNCEEFMRSKFRYDHFKKYDYLMKYKYLIDIV